jgi:PKD repeat protein
MNTYILAFNFVLALALCGFQAAPAASISAPTYSSTLDSSPLTNDLTHIGLFGDLDWQIYSGAATTLTNGTVNLMTIGYHKAGGTSITNLGMVAFTPTTFDSVSSRSATKYSWSDGAAPNTSSAGTNPSSSNNGWRVANAATFAADVNYETFQFVPKDTNSHTVYIYGYYAGNTLNVNLQFETSLSGVSTPPTTTPTAAFGNFIYSVTFQADHPTDALTVKFTFGKTSNNGTLTIVGISAAAIDGSSPNSPVTVNPPSNLDALGGEGVVNLNWSANSANTAGISYKVYRNATGSLTNYQLIAANVTDTNYDDTTVIVGSNYFYAVTTVSNGQESAFSVQDGAEPFMVHTGDVLVVNGDTTVTTNKNWTLSSLNNANPTVTGTAGTATGAFTSAGVLGAGDSFSFTVSSVMNWSGAAAQAALLTNGFGNYLNSLPAGKIGVFQFNLGVDSTAINPSDNANTLNGTNEALVYTFSTSNLSTGRLFLTSFNFANYVASASTDFVIYDPSGNQVTVQYWDQNYNSSTYGGIAYNSEFLLQNGYKIVVGTGASNTNSSWRASSPQLDIVTGATVPPDLTLALYDFWAASYGGTALIGSPTNDFDGDGLANLMEYALGGNPTNNLDTGTAPTLINTNGTLLFVYPKRCDNANLVYSIQSSTNLVNWTNASYTVTGTNVTGAILNYVTNAMATNGLQTYLRLTVQADNLLVSSSYLSVLSPPTLPVAGFTATPTNGIRPLVVTFIDTSAGSITNLLWNFGDSQTTNTAAGAVVAHTYKTNGTYTVSLKASGAGGSNTNTQAGLATVLVPNPPQIISIQPMEMSALVLQGTGGPTNGGYYYWLRSSTNITLPLTNWSIVATNPFDVYGNFSNQIPLTPGTPQSFYRVQMP